MSEIQKGRPTIYGEVQSPRRRTGRPGVHTYGAESQKRYAGRMTEHYGSAQMEDAGRPALGNRARTEQAPRRRTSVSAPEVYTAPFDRPAHGWENMPEQELRRTDFASDRKLRALWSVFGILAVTVTMFRHDMAWGMVLLVPGAVTMVLGAILAVFSIDLKRTLACSSMSQIGFILTGCAMQCLLGEENGLAVSGTVLHMVNHSMIKLVLFMAAGCIYMNLHKLDLNEIRGYGRNKPFLMLVFAMGAYGICGIPLWNGYVSKTLLHESIVEYIEVLGAQGADALPFQVLEWAFLLAGGLTVAYMAKLFAAIFLEKAPMGRERDDREKRYAGTAACFALGGSACLLPLMGMAPHRIMDRMADISRPFLRGAQVPHQVEYFSEANLRGACISITIGILVYVLFIRRYLMETGEDGTRVYVDRWPAWLNLEDRVYRPLVLAVLPFLGAVLARCVNGICEGPLPLFMKRPEKNQVVAPGESSRFFRQAQDVRLLHMIYSSMGYGFMMLGAGLILMTAYVLFL